MQGLIGPLRSTPRGELAHAQNAKLFREHIRAALLTRAQGEHGDEVGERLMRESFGSRIQELLHEGLTEETAELAEAILAEDLQRSLPHLTLTHIETHLQQEQQKLNVNLQFELPNSETLTYKTDIKVHDDPKQQVKIRQS